MKLSAWAKKHGYSYTGAWLKFKRGGLPGAYQLEDGTILVKEEHNKLNKVEDGEEDLIQDFVSVITSFCARIYGKRRSKRKTELILKELDED